MALYDINGNVIATGGSGGDSFFKEIETMQNGLQLPAVPNDFKSTDDWEYTANSGNLATALGKTRYMYKECTFTGRVYVRFTKPTPYTGIPVNMHLVAEDYISNPTVEGTELVATKTISKFDGKYIVVSEDGATYEAVSAETSGYYGYVVLQQFDIPEGKYAVLTSTGKGTNNGSNAYIPNWFTVFTLDPTDNITQIPTGEALAEVVSDNAEGFAKGTAQNDYFLKYLKEVIDGAMPVYYRPQTFGKSLFVGGDSLHAYAGGNGFDAPGFISTYNKHLGFKTVRNASWAGQTMSGTTAGGGVYYAKELITNGKPYDVLIFAYGSNRDANGLGTATDAASDTALTLAGSMKWIIENLRAAFPKSAIGFMTPPPSSNSDNAPARELIKEICEIEHIPYADLFYNVAFSDLSDGSHLGAGGGIKYGAAEAKLILDICPYGDPLT